MDGLRKFRNYHFIGIGGIGMSGLAKILVDQGCDVSGSDIAMNPRLDELRGLGADIRIGHTPVNLNGAEVVVVSSAISINNPEVKSAIRRSIPIIHRSEMLSLIMSHKKGIAIAGTHGKTTTTALTSMMTMRAGLDPTLIIGGILPELGSNCRLGGGEYVVAEADESDGSLVRLEPYIGVVTNIEADHMDYYDDSTSIRKTFGKFMSRIRSDGAAVLCTDDPNVKMLSEEFTGEKITYGLNNGAHLKAVDVQFTNFGSTFTATYRGLEMGRFRISVPGMHNIYNALATIGVGKVLGVEQDVVQQALRDFKGAKRRFEVIESDNGLTVVDDYAHHPTEIMATLSAARKVHREGRIISVFQPHRFTRTKYFFDLYGQCFFNSDEVVVTDIYAAGEAPIAGVSGELVAEMLKKYGHGGVTYVPELGDVAGHVRRIARKKDFVITLGAGDVWKVAYDLSQHALSA